MERRTLIRLLVGLGIGVPIAIEAATFFGLFGSRVVGDGDGTETPSSPTETPSPDAVGVGDELLPATAATDTVTGAEIRTEDGERVFVLTVAVENDTDEGYELRLDALTTDAGTTVSGGGRTTQLDPGEETTVFGRWPLPDDERPRAVIVVATVTPAGGGRETVTRRVPIAIE